VVMTILALACGAGVGLGVTGLVRAYRSAPSPQNSRTPRTGRSKIPGLASERVSSWVFPFALGAGSAFLAGILTRWPAAIVLAAVGGAGLPALLRVTRRSDAGATTEAIAVWTELLRDTLAAASGLSQAIVATAPLAPDPIRKEVGVLAARLSNGMPIPDAMRLFADELGNPSADLVVCALILAATARAQRLVDLLGALADSMREEVAMRLRVESGRASARSGVRTIVMFSIGFVALIALLSHSYLEPFGSSSGQLVLLLAGGLDSAGIALMVRLVRDEKPQRLLAGSSVTIENLR
jgi:tight adherence protein B